MLKMALGGQGFDGRGIILNDMRHVEALRRAEKALSQAQKVVEARSSIEFAAEDIKLAVNELDVITGRHVDDDVLEQIFSKFCIGK